MRLTPLKTGGGTTETPAEIPQLVETNSMTTGLGAARNAEQAKGFCVLSGALARRVLELLEGVIGSAAARTGGARQTGAVSTAVRITWRNEIEAARMPCL